MLHRRVLTASHWLAITLIALAVAMRVALPTGYMLAPGAGFTLMPCDGHMPATAMPGMAMPGMKMASGATGGHAPSHPDAPMPDHPCAFAATSAAVDAPVLAIIAPPPVSRDVPLLAATGDAFPGRGLAAPPPFATGPPLIA